MTDRGLAYLLLPSLKKLDLEKGIRPQEPALYRCRDGSLERDQVAWRTGLAGGWVERRRAANLAPTPQSQDSLISRWCIYRHPKNHPIPTRKGLKELAGVRSLESLFLAGPGVTDAALSGISHPSQPPVVDNIRVPHQQRGLSEALRARVPGNAFCDVPSHVTISGLNCLNGLSRLSNLRADSLTQDGLALNLAGLSRLDT